MATRARARALTSPAADGAGSRAPLRGAIESVPAGSGLGLVSAPSDRPRELSVVSRGARCRVRCCCCCCRCCCLCGCSGREVLFFAIGARCPASRQVALRVNVGRETIGRRRREQEISGRISVRIRIRIRSPPSAPVAGAAVEFQQPQAKAKQTSDAR